MEWLRDKAFASLDDSETSAGRKWAIAIAGVTILFAGLAYLLWMPRPQNVPEPPPVAEVTSSPASTPQPGQMTPALTVPSPTPAEQEAPAADSAAEGSAPTAVVRPSAASPEPPVSEAAAGTAGGNEELLMAQRYLDGEAGERDSAQAAKWLWRAVAKQNSHATLLLADLYARGDGVPKSCDQARLLLLAAVRKGATGAAQKLRNLEFRGCQ